MHSLNTAVVRVSVYALRRKRDAATTNEIKRTYLSVTF